VAAQKIRREMKGREYGSGGGGSVRRVKLSPNMNRNSGAGVEGRVAVLEVKAWSGLGMLERPISGLGVFGGGFHLRLCLLRGGLSGQTLAIWNMELLGPKSW